MGRKPKNTDGFKIVGVEYVDGHVVETFTNNSKEEVVARLKKTWFDSDTKKRFLDVMEFFTSPNRCYSLMAQSRAAHKIISLIDIAEGKDPTY